MSEPQLLTANQREVWDVMKPHDPKPSGDQTAQQACNLGVLSFLYWCAFDGLSPEPTQAAVTAEFVAAGVPELAPSDDFWDDLRRAPGQIWTLSPRGTDAWKHRS